MLIEGRTLMRCVLSNIITLIIGRSVVDVEANTRSGLEEIRYSVVGSRYFTIQQPLLVSVCNCHVLNHVQQGIFMTPLHTKCII